MSETATPDVLKLTAQIVSAHVAHNKLGTEALIGLINSVYQSLASAGHVEPPAPALTPAVPIKRSVFPDHIICLEDGKKLKMLKRHLRTSYNMTPDQYRAKWGLMADYPMVSPNYAKHRSALAKQIGLGRKVEEQDTPAPVKLVPARRGRPRRM